MTEVDPHELIRDSTKRLLVAVIALVDSVRDDLSVKERALFAACTASMQTEIDAEVPWDSHVGCWWCGSELEGKTFICFECMAMLQARLDGMEDDDDEA